MSRARSPSGRAVALLALIAAALGAAWWWQRESTRHAPIAARSPGAAAHAQGRAIEPIPLPSAVESAGDASIGARREERPPASDVPSMLTIEVRVVDETATPIAGAEVVALADLLSDRAAPEGSRFERRSDASGLTTFTLPRELAPTLRWVTAYDADCVPAVLFLGGHFTAEALADATVAVTVVLEKPRSWAVRVGDVYGRPIAGAHVQATAAWGEELRSTPSDAAARRRITPEATTDADGRATLCLSPTLPYFVEAFSDGFTPFAAVVSPDDAIDAAVEIPLRRLFVAGYRTVGGPSGDVGMIATDVEESYELWRNPRFRTLLGIQETLLRRRFEQPDAQLSFQPERASGAPPDDWTVTVLLAGEERELTLHFRPLAEFLASDVVELAYPPPGTAAVHVQLVSESGARPDAEFGWWLQQMGRFRAVHPTAVDAVRARLTFSDLEAGAWRFGTPNFAFRRLLPVDAPFELRAGEVREIEVTVPTVLGARLHLVVRDGYGRTLTRYQAMLRSASGYFAVLDRFPLPIEPGRYPVTVRALGYADCTVELDIDGPDVTHEVVIGTPSDMALPWSRRSSRAHRTCAAVRPCATDRPRLHRERVRGRFLRPLLQRPAQRQHDREHEAAAPVEAAPPARIALPAHAPRRHGRAAFHSRGGQQLAQRDLAADASTGGDAGDQP